MANRLKVILPSIIDFNQGGFVAERNILDGVLTMHEVIHSMDKSRTTGFLLKLNMNKAYDRLSCDFLFQILQKFGFHQNWIKLMKSCIYDPYFSIPINGVA